jgi:hypothetical protein
MHQSTESLHQVHSCFVNVVLLIIINRIIVVLVLLRHSLILSVILYRSTHGRQHNGVCLSKTKKMYTYKCSLTFAIL